VIGSTAARPYPPASARPTGAAHGPRPAPVTGAPHRGSLPRPAELTGAAQAPRPTRVTGTPQEPARHG
jgi:hypothetical protein